MNPVYSSYLQPDTLAIFLFHGVIPKQRHEVRNYTSKHIESSRFREILDDLSSHGTPFSMPDVVAYTRTRQPWPENAFVLTFDDGFANNYHIAAPMLESAKIPGCFYLTTRFVGWEDHSWIDQIEYAVEKQTARQRVEVPALGIDTTLSNRVDKIQFLDQVRKTVKSNSAIDPYHMASLIWKQLKVDVMDPDHDLDKKMSWSQASELQKHPLFTVGGHGHTHRILAYLPPLELEEEIDTSLQELNSHLEKPVEHYSYPEGLSHCYSPAVINALKWHGIACSPTAMDGVNTIGSDLFHLKRIMVV